jgi:hypothetical protein
MWCAVRGARQKKWFSASREPQAILFNLSTLYIQAILCKEEIH